MALTEKDIELIRFQKQFDLEFYKEHNIIKDFTRPKVITNEDGDVFITFNVVPTNPQKGEVFSKCLKVKT